LCFLCFLWLIFLSKLNHPAHRREGILLALIAAALWGFTPVATKGALEGFTPQFLSFVRLAAAALFFRALAGRGARFFVSDPWIWLAGVGLGADFLLYNYGVQRTSANVAGLVINIELLTTIAFAVWILGERLNTRRVMGGMITAAGVLIVSLEGLSFSGVTRNDRAVGNVLVMLASISWSLFAVAQRRTEIKGGLFHRLTPIFSIASLITAPAMLQRDAWSARLSVSPIVMFIVLTVLGTGLVYWVYGRAQQLVDVSLLAIVLCTIPVFAVAFAYAFLGEPVTGQLVVGGTVILAGILLIATESAQL
jgi:drug/metabolite transporter (DMT)-like permease